MTVEEDVVAELDETEAAAMLAGDVEQLADIWGEEFFVNNPFNVVVDRESVLDMVSTRRIAYSSFERTLEATRVDSDVAITMGRELVRPVGSSDDVERRYTHVWRRFETSWRLVARHASVVRA